MAWQPPIGKEGHGLHICVANTAGGASRARKQLIDFIQHSSLDRQIVADIEVAVGEALANAAEHGYKLRGTIVVDAWLSEDCLEWAVSDDGPGFFLRGPISVDHPVALSPRGYGLFMMQALVDELEFRNDGKTVWFRKRFGTGGRGSRQ